jgi:hypothetical protein
LGGIGFSACVGNPVPDSIDHLVPCAGTEALNTTSAGYWALQQTLSSRISL